MGTQRKPADARLSMDRTLAEFADHCHAERRHKGKANKLRAVRRDSGLETNAGGALVLGGASPYRSGGSWAIAQRR